jgi:hypothetical protein
MSSLQILSCRHNLLSVDWILSVILEPQTLFSIHGHDPLCDFRAADTIFCLQTWSSLWLLSCRHYFPSADTILSVTSDPQTLFSICRHNPLCNFSSADTIFCLRTWSSLWIWAADTIFHLQTQSFQWFLIGRHYFLSADMILSVDLSSRHYFLSADTILSVTFDQRTLFLSADMILS